MGISRPGINPNTFYWDKKKDTRILAEFIKVFSETGGPPKQRFFEFFKDAVNLIRKLEPNFKLIENERLISDIDKIIDHILSQRTHHPPTETEIDEILDGERIEISQKVAEKIGQILDKALYYKFKNKRRTI